MVVTRRRFALAAVFALAIAVRAGHGAAIRRSPAAQVPVLDAAYYQERSERLLGILPSPPDEGAPFMNVGYPYALAAVYSVTGPDANAAVAVQSVVDALTAVLLALALEALLGDLLVGLIAGTLWSLYRVAVFYDGLLLTPCMIDAALAVGLYFLTRLRRTGRRRDAIASGVAIAAAILLRANNVILAPVFALGAWMRDEETPKRPTASAALLLASALLPPAAVTAIHGIRSGAWVPLTANAGMNFWVGNNRGAAGIYYVADFLGDRGTEAEPAAYLAEARHRSGDRTLSLAASSRFWFREGLHEIRLDPGRWLGLEMRKLLLFWNGAEVKTNVSLGFVTGLSPVLRWLPVRFTWIAVLGIAGISLIAIRAFAGDARFRPPAVVLIGLVAAPLLTSLAFFVSGEYRHPASLALVAGTAFVLAEALRRRPETITVTSIVGAAVSAAVVAPLAFWPLPRLEMAFHPDLDYRSVIRTVVAPGLDAPPAPAAFERAWGILRAAPGFPDGSLYLLDTRMWLSWRQAAVLGDPNQASVALDTARELLAANIRPGFGDYDPAYLIDLRRLVVARVKDLGSLPAVRNSPELSIRAALLGANDFREAQSLLSTGDKTGARRFLEDALAQTPGRVEVLARLGKELLAEGETARGLELLRDATLGWPAIPEAPLFIAQYYESQGDHARAKQAMDEAIRRGRMMTSIEGSKR
jgi:tetratricopeptide (TPR) repeat protein